ncbi:MAG TPA: hypothetical protein PKH33_05865 [bacterium]|nr:hypothetical protein [bacterium]
MTQKKNMLGKWSSFQLVFIALMVAADVGMGFVVKPLLGVTGIDQIIRLDLILPTAFMILTRLMIDRFGTILIYELIWGVVATLAMPTSFGGLPGPVKLIPALVNGLLLDSLLELFKNRPAVRVAFASVAGGAAATAAFMLVRVAFGFPWSKVVKILLGLQMATNMIVYAAGALLGLKIWQSIKDTYLAKTISGNSS